MVPTPAESAFSSPILVLLLLILFSFLGYSESHEASQSSVSIKAWAAPYGCAIVNVERVIGQNIQERKTNRVCTSKAIISVIIERNYKSKSVSNDIMYSVFEVHSKVVDKWHLLLEGKENKTP